MKILGKKGNHLALLLAGVFLVLSSLVIFEASSTSAQVRTVQSKLGNVYASLADFRTLVQAVKQNNNEIKDNTRMLEQLQREVEKIKRDNKEQSKKFDKKIPSSWSPG